MLGQSAAKIMQNFCQTKLYRTYSHKAYILVWDTYLMTVSTEGPNGPVLGYEFTFAPFSFVTGLLSFFILAMG